MAQFLKKFNDILGPVVKQFGRNEQIGKSPKSQSKVYGLNTELQVMSKCVYKQALAKGLSYLRILFLCLEFQT